MSKTGWYLLLVGYICLTVLFSCQAGPKESAALVTAVPPTATVLLTAVPTHLPTATPTATPSPTSSATPAPSLTPSPPPTITPTPTATPDTAVYGQLDTLKPAAVVIFWHSYDGFAQTVLEEIVADFNASNPYGVTVQMIPKPGYNAIYDGVMAAMDQPAERPGLVAAFPNQIVAYGPAVVDLRPYVHHPFYGFSPPDLADFFPAATIDRPEPLYGLPLHRVMELLYVNEAWLASLSLPFTGAPLTPAHFAQAACAAADPAQGITGYEIEPTSGSFLAWVTAFGGDVYNETTHTFTFDTPAATAAMTMLQQLLQDECAVVASGFDYQEHFARQQTLFGPGTSRGLYFYGRAVNTHNTTPFTWSVAALPHTTDTAVPFITGPDFAIMHTNPETQLGAWLFLKHFFSPETQARWARVNDYLPARAAAADHLHAHFLENPAYAAAFVLMAQAQNPPAPTGNYDIWQAMTDAYGRLLNGEAVTAVLQELEQATNQAVP